MKKTKQIKIVFLLFLGSLWISIVREIILYKNWRLVNNCQGQEFCPG